MHLKHSPPWIHRLILIFGVGIALVFLCRLGRQDIGSMSDALVPDHSSAPADAGPGIHPAIPPSSDVPPVANTVHLAGDDATAGLAGNGKYQLIGAALAAARLAVEKIDPADPNSRGADYFAANPGQRLRAWFGNRGVELASGNLDPEGKEPWTLALRLRGIGRGEDITPVSSGIPSGEGSRVQMEHPNVGMVQWFDNRSEGLEQGFTVRQPPEGPIGKVTLALDVEGNLRAESMDSGDGIRLVTFNGIEKVRYSGLKAWDATGRDLKARMEPDGADGLTLLVSDEDAIYPLTIDPLFANVEARLVQSSDGNFLGSSVSLSGDTALIGVPGAASAYVFTRSGTTWSKQAQLASADEDTFGNFVALSGDTALVGPHVFVRTGTVWNKQAKLVATDGTLLDGPVALEGNTALIGAHVFLRSGTTWNQQAKLVPSGGGNLDGSVALSGNTALASSTTSSGNRNVHVFIRVGTVWSQQATLGANDLSTGDFYGSSVAISGDTALVGAPNQTIDILGEGSVYFFKRSGTSWTSQGKLSGFTDGDAFGASLAVSGATAVIGGPGIYTHTATVVARSGSVWSRIASIDSPAGAGAIGFEDFSGFGSAVAFSGTTILVGAPSSDTSAGKSAGSAYAFVLNGSAWTQQSDFEIDDSPADDRNGYAVSISGDTALVGAINDGLARSGCVYVFARQGMTWIPQARLTGPEGGSSVSFGTSVDLSGNTAIVGSPGDDAAYVFSRSGAVWNQQAKLTVPGGNFGDSVAISGETALIGSSFEAIGGSAYVYVRNGTTWTQQAKLKSPAPEDRDIFGGAVAISGDIAVIGALLDDTQAGTDAGSAYLFKRVGSVWNQEAQLSPGDASAADFFGISVALAGGPFTSTTTWQNIPIGSRGGSFEFNFRLSPKAALMNGVAGLVSGAAEDYPDLACAVRLNPSGHFDVRNGSSYGASSQLAYVAGQVYEVAMTVDTASSTYSVSINGIPIATDFAFGTEQTGLTKFDHLALRNETGALAVSNYTPLTALIGASGDDTEFGADTGSAHVFVNGGNGWLPQARITAGDAAPDDNFGRAVALERDTAVVGAYTDDTVAGSGSGSAYAFVRYGTLWNQELKLTSGVDASPGDSFGISVSLSGSTVLIGSPNDDTAGPDAGSAYTFLLGELPTITRQPVSRTVPLTDPGTQVVFSVTATGYEPLFYQWRRNGSLITGATASSYTIPAARDADQGDYDCVVSNIGGVVTSAPATLSVNQLSEFDQTFPGPPPSASGLALVTILPAVPTAGWRFVGEKRWRVPGLPVAGLTLGAREIEFRPVPGFNHPPRETVILTVENLFASITRSYYEAPKNGTGELTVTLKPDSIATTARWRFLGEGDAAWRASDFTAKALAPGNYLVECESAGTLVTPPPANVAIGLGKKPRITLTYGEPDTQTGTLATLVPFATVSTNRKFPYAYVGQIRSDAGLSSGFVVKPRVVATAAHVVFDEKTKSAVINLEWLFQRDRGSYEPTPQIPRGFYRFDSYAAARGEPGVVEGEGTPKSQHYDAAALYLDVDTADAARGGSSGFLASNATDNEFLLSDANKMLVGYPIDQIEASNQGRMHATPEMNVKFSRVPGEVVAGVPYRTYTTGDIRSSGGASGGPLCVQFESGNYYPAAIYLGGSGQTVVRAIDEEVITLFDRAEISATTGKNNTDGGFTLTSVVTLGAPSSPGALQVVIQPAAARIAGARWLLKPEPDTSYRSSGSQKSGLSAGSYNLQLSAVKGFQIPTLQAVTVNGGELRQFTYTYAKAPRIAIEQPKGTGLKSGSALISLGSAGLGSSTGKTFTIRNLGTSKLKNLKISIDGKNPENFSFSPPEESALPPGATTTFKVTFTPTLKRKFDAVIHIASNDKDGSPFDIKLTGKGVTGIPASPALPRIARLPSWKELHPNGPFRRSLPHQRKVIPAVMTLPDGNNYRTLTVEVGLLEEDPTVEVSSDLVDWYNGNKHTTVLLRDLFLLKVRDNTPFTAERKRFIRVSPR